jgi:N-acetylneuraminate synthase
MANVRKLIDFCAFFGVDYVKFQKRNCDVCVPDIQKLAMRDTPWGRMTYLGYRHKMEFSLEQYEEIDGYCREKGIKWAASAWDKDSVDFLARFDTDFIKIPSACITDLELLRYARASGVPIVLSTGAADWPIVDAAVKVLGESLIYLLHCTSTYPSADTEQNLSCVTSLQHRYPHVKIGFSNHAAGSVSSIAAIALGARMVEVHITLSRAMWGSDHAASFEPEKVWHLCKYRDYLDKALGDGEKCIYESERPIMARLRRVG